MSEEFEFDLEPLEDMVLIREVTRESKYIKLLGDAKHTAVHEVLAVGPGRVSAGTLVEPRLKVGDLVMLKSGAFVHQPPVNPDKVGLVRETDFCARARPKGEN